MLLVDIGRFLVVLGDSLAGWGFTAGAEQITECCDPLQKLRVRLGFL